MVDSEGDDEGRIHDDVVFFFSCGLGLFVFGMGYSGSCSQRPKPTMEAQRLQ